MKPHTPSSIKSRPSSKKSSGTISYRILLKSKNGTVDNRDSKSVSLNSKFSNTSNSFRNDDIKSYVKNMKNRAPSGNTFSQRKLNTSTNNQQECLSEGGKSSRLSAKNNLKSSRNIFNGEKMQILREMTIDQIQNMVDQLLCLKLQKLKHKRGDNNFQIQQISKKIQRIVQFLQSSNNQDLNFTNRTIGIFEKIMAESSTQSEIAKKYFYSKKTLRKPKFLNMEKYKINVNLLKTKTQFLIKKTIPSPTEYESTAQHTFKAPDKKYYLVKQPKPKYQVNNQPIQRSSYNRDYLVYGSLPRFVYKQSSSHLLPSHSSSKNKSCYTQSFTNKKIQKLNFKQLDCYQDKFKNLKVSFLPPHNKIQQSKFQLQKPIILLQSNTKHRSKTQSCHYIHHLSTESRTNFTTYSNKISSEIKHKNLHNLKHAYKQSLYS